jgi:hypothetical protein
VGRYPDGLDTSISTKKLHPAGIRRFFDRLITRRMVALNPAASARGARY